ncbi:MAG TPA: acyl-CoA dehydrogenase family protein [Methylomirabilota bacterium]|nr:acyl-CoA dehydrogenase family protein [Methylomirabilota bacterium]
MELLTRLLRGRPVVIDVGDDIAAWWRRFCAAEPDRMTPFDRAVTAGFRANRVAGAFAGGYQGALRALVADRLGDDVIASFCVSEPGGNSPRAIETTLTRHPDGRFVLDGQKRWSTMAPVADVLLVAAHQGLDAAGRKPFKLVYVEAGAPGLTITRMPPTKFIPEIPHAELRLQEVVVSADALLPGDGYVGYVKRFRTVEDVYIHGGILGYALGAARRFVFPQTVIERLASAIAATRVLAVLDADAPETHVALAGTLARDANLLDHSDAHWEKAEEAERTSWRRDRQGFSSVAGALREARRVRAWERLAEPETGR